VAVPEEGSVAAVMDYIAPSQSWGSTDSDCPDTVAEELVYALYMLVEHEVATHDVECMALDCTDGESTTETFWYPVGGDPEGVASPIYGSEGQLAGYTMAITQDDFFKWQYEREQNTGSLEFVFRWETNATNAVATYYDEFTVTVTGNLNPCYGSTVALASSSDVTGTLIYVVEGSGA
jgi:hypothetical protein